MRRFSFLFIAVFFLSCQGNDGLTLQQDRAALLVLFDEIETISNSISCDDDSDWSFVAYGHKACGGPQGYIAYSNQIDVPEFLVLIENYTQAERNYNIKWGIISTCDLPAVPTGVRCENGDAVLNY